MAEEEIVVKKSKRGRKRIEDGGKPSPRKVSCVCSAIIDGELVSEDIRCPNSDKDTPDDVVQIEASLLFEQRFGQKPGKIKGPCFMRVGGGAVKKKPVKKIDYSLEDISFVKGKSASAVYKDWNVKVRFIENDDDVVFIFYKGHTTENKTTRPSNKFVYLNTLEEFQLEE